MVVHALLPADRYIQSRLVSLQRMTENERETGPQVGSDESLLVCNELGLGVSIDDHRCQSRDLQPTRCEVEEALRFEPRALLP